MGVGRTKVPAVLARLERRFATWRKSRSVGERIPKRLWKAAVQVAVKAALDYSVDAPTSFVFNVAAAWTDHHPDAGVKSLPCRSLGAPRVPRRQL